MTQEMQGATPVQSYSPYRAKILTREELRELSRLRPWIGIRDTLWLWLQILSMWFAVAIVPQWWMVALAIPVIGTRYYGLYIIGHDGMHRRIFSNVSLNDTWADIFVFGHIGAITRLNRLNHMIHHDTLALQSDPDRYKYRSADKKSRWRVLAVLTGLPYFFRALSNVFRPRAVSTATRPGGYRGRDIAVLVSCQGALIGGLSFEIGWWAYPLLWLVPVYIFTFTADIVRVFLEHSRPGDDEAADRDMRLVTYFSNPIERRFFAPNNMNFHAAHHLWPSIPYYNLQKANQLMRNSPLCDENLVWRHSYLGYLAEYWRQTAQTSKQNSPITSNLA